MPSHMVATLIDEARLCCVLSLAEVLLGDGYSG